MDARLYRRRLEEVRVFARACNGLADSRPDLSARSGLGLLMGGYSLLGTFVVFAALRPAALTAGLTVILAVRRYDVGAFIP